MPFDIVLQPMQPWDMIRNQLRDGREAACDAMGVEAGEAERGDGACIHWTDSIEEGCEDGRAPGGLSPSFWIVAEDIGVRLRCGSRSLLGIRTAVEAEGVGAVEDRNGFRVDGAVGGEDGGGREVVMRGVALDGDGWVDPSLGAIADVLFAAGGRVVAEDGVNAEGGGVDGAFCALDAEFGGGFVEELGVDWETDLCD